ncbi:MAG: YHS domain protein [Cyclobacteriaceae bacterium]|nr:YHS domain protein [Cyclobacteriaceae bacterium]
MARFFSATRDLFRTIFLKAEKPPVFSTKEGALRGFDPVCYFTIGTPQKGSADYAYLYNGAIWHFVSAENLSTFKTNPSQFVPQFGGYCSFGMASCYKADTQPDAWTIIDGKLYMNYSLAVRTKWNENQPVYIEKANTNWAKEKQR